MTQSNKPIIIQLLGQARSGKDWTASQLKSYFESQGESVEIMSYAAPMKQIAAVLFDISLETLNELKNNSDRYEITLVDHNKRQYENSIEDYFSSNFRTLLQRLGNEAMKPIFGDAVWANLMHQSIHKSSADIIIIPDCRFIVELKAVGGITVRVINHALPPPMQHASELELADYVANFTLDNTVHGLTLENITELANTILKEANAINS